jgi:hypothetical protein
LAGKGALRYSVGTDICFDDWCATVDSLQQVFLTSHDSAAYDLVITRSNHTRGIAQRPSEPRVHLIDDQGRNWPPIALGAIPLNARPELRGSKTTTMKFVVPTDAANLQALIEEGPWITHFLFPEDQPAFKLP